MNKKVLFVDDDANLLAGFQRQLRKNFSIETALTPEQGLTALESGDVFGVVVADMGMPGMTGIEFLQQVKERTPRVVRIMLTGHADIETAIQAFNEGSIFRFLTKPCDIATLSGALEAGLQQHDLLVAEHELREKTLSGCIKVLTEILALVAPGTFQQAESLRDRSRLIGRAMNIRELWDLEVAAMLCQLGQVTIPAELLARVRADDALNEEETALLQRVPQISGNLLAHIPRMEKVVEIIRYHAKDFDGKGPPNDPVSGEAIPIGARILHVLTELHRLEQQGLSINLACDQFRQQRDRYDPTVVEQVYMNLGVVQRVSRRGPHSICLQQLRVGHILMADMQGADGNVVLAAGNQITPVVLEHLRNYADLVGVKEPLLVEDPANSGS